MRMFTNLLYDICTVFELFKEGESPRDKRKSTDFGAHQRFWDQRYNELSQIIDAEGVYSLEQRRIIFSRYEYFYYMMNSGNDSNLLIVFYVQIMPDDFVMQLHRF
ncbi:hypothetical protein LL12F53_39300 [Escherichia coli]